MVGDARVRAQGKGLGVPYCSPVPSDVRSIAHDGRVPEKAREYKECGAVSRGKKPRRVEPINTGEATVLVHERCRHLNRIHGRLPILQALKVELDKMGDLPVGNRAVLRMVRDSFDMLVIDLYSLRDGLVKDAGLLNRLRPSFYALRKFTEADISGVAVLAGC